jgi:hypothetical protein
MVLARSIRRLGDSSGGALVTIENFQIHSSTATLNNSSILCVATVQQRTGTRSQTQLSKRTEMNHPDRIYNSYYSQSSTPPKEDVKKSS